MVTIGFHGYQIQQKGNMKWFVFCANNLIMAKPKLVFKIAAILDVCIVSGVVGP